MIILLIDDCIVVYRIYIMYREKKISSTNIEMNSSTRPSQQPSTNTPSSPTTKTAQPKTQVSFLDPSVSTTPNVPLSSYSKGMIVQAKYSGDGKYYRARIDDIQGNQFLVLYLDFSGSQEWVHSSGVKLVV